MGCCHSHVDRLVGLLQNLGWRIGDEIVVTASGGDVVNATEHRNITDVELIGDCCSKVTLDSPLDHTHVTWIANPEPDSFTPDVPIQVEVGVVSHNIVIRKGIHSEAGTGLPDVFLRQAGSMEPSPPTNITTFNASAPALAGTSHWEQCTNYTDLCGNATALALPNATNVALCYALRFNASSPPDLAAFSDHDPLFGPRIRAMAADQLSATLAVAAALSTSSSGAPLWPPASATLPAPANSLVQPVFQAVADQAAAFSVSTEQPLARLDSSLHPSMHLIRMTIVGGGQTVNGSAWRSLQRLYEPSLAATPTSLQEVLHNSSMEHTTACIASTFSAVAAMLPTEPTVEFQARHRHAAVEVAVSTVVAESVVVVPGNTTPPLAPPTQSLVVQGCAVVDAVGDGVVVAASSLSAGVTSVCRPSRWQRDPFMYFGDSQAAAAAAAAAAADALSSAELRTLTSHQTPTGLSWCPPDPARVLLPVAAYQPLNVTAPAVLATRSRVQIVANVVVRAHGRGVVLVVGGGAEVSGNVVVDTRLFVPAEDVLLMSDPQNTTRHSASFASGFDRHLLSAAFDVRHAGHANVHSNVATGAWGVGFLSDAANRVDAAGLCRPSSSSSSSSSESTSVGVSSWSTANYNASSQNVARNNAFGVVLFDSRTFACSELAGFTVLLSWEVGVLAWSSTSIVIRDMVLLGNAVGVSANVYQPDLATHRQVHKSVTLYDSLVAARATPASNHANASAVTDPFGVCVPGLAPPVRHFVAYPWSHFATTTRATFPDHSPNSVTTVGRVGVLTSLFMSTAPDLSRYAAHQAGSFPALLGLARVERVAFFGFVNRTVEAVGDGGGEGGTTAWVSLDACGMRAGEQAVHGGDVETFTEAVQAWTGVGVVVNPSATDVTHPHHFANLTWGSGHTNASRLFMWGAVGSVVGQPGGCGDTDCGGHRSVLLQDLDGSLVGSLVDRGNTRWSGIHCVSVVAKGDVWSSDAAQDPIPASVLTGA